MKDYKTLNYNKILIILHLVKRNHLPIISLLVLMEHVHILINILDNDLI